MASSGGGSGGQPPLVKGMIFASTKTLRKEATLAFHQENCGIKHSPKSGGSSTTYHCSGYEGPGQGCTAINRAQKQKSGEWKVTLANLNHVNCDGGNKANSTLGIENIVASTVSSNRRISTPALKKTIEMQTGRKASSRTVNRARGVMLNSSEKHTKDVYSILPAYLKELQDNSPGTVATAERDPETGKMTRMFVMTGRTVHVATNSALKIVCVDAGLLKGDYEGQIIVMSTKDSDSKLVTTAFAVVDVENAAGFAYLFREAKNPDMTAFLNSPDTTIYADGHLGTPAAKAKELPLSQFRNCVKHLIGSF